MGCDHRQINRDTSQRPQPMGILSQQARTAPQAVAAVASLADAQSNGNPYTATIGKEFYHFHIRARSAINFIWLESSFFSQSSDVNFIPNNLIFTMQ